MNPFAFKMIWLGAVGVCAGGLLLTMNDAMPGAIWRGSAILVLGCILILLGCRGLSNKS